MCCFYVAEVFAMLLSCVQIDVCGKGQVYSYFWAIQANTLMT